MLRSLGTAGGDGRLHAQVRLPAALLRVMARWADRHGGRSELQRAAEVKCAAGCISCAHHCLLATFLSLKPSPAAPLVD